jgi:Leucine-rich repeat (LRR) protein
MNYLCSIFLSIILFSSPSFSDEVSKLENVKTLEISNSKNESQLQKIGEYKSLKNLTINCLESLQEIPDAIGELKYLEELNMDNGNGCAMNPQLPSSLGNLSQLKMLNLAGAQDNRIGKQVGPRHKLPESMSKLTKLDTLNLSRNGLTEIPEIILKMPNLRALAFEFNDLADLPDWLVKMPKLESISLGGNWKISCSSSKQAKLQKRFPKISLSFHNEYDCPEK